ncbi:MAG TPA: hypothetical protein VFI60_10735, partial [Candidatus Acidoferrum sp.]|nr:hypothetical protein [Candidatus Acidoferrum sp.]
RIEELEADAQQEENLAAQMEHPANGAGAGAAILNTLGTFGSARFRFEAVQYHDQAARLRGELWQLERENQLQLSAAVPASN